MWSGGYAPELKRIKRSRIRWGMNKDTRTQHQKEVSETILFELFNFLRNKNHHPLVSLTGSAGVGKTFLTNYIVQINLII